MEGKNAGLLLFGALQEDAVISAVCQLKSGNVGRAEETALAHRAALGLLDFAVRSGMEGDLWQNYLAWRLTQDENAFSLLAEQRSPGDCTLTTIARREAALLYDLFHYDISALPGSESFALLRSYRAPERRRNAAYAPAETLSGRLAAAKSSEDFYRCIADFYCRCGVGQLALHRAFRVSENSGGFELCCTDDFGQVRLTDLVGYDGQKRRLLENTASFVSGKKANNVLLYGDAGTGKSTCIRALLNEFPTQGLRMIQLYKHQMHLLPKVLSQIRERNFRFILFLDDLSFEEHEVEYKYLKAAMEGGIEECAGNVLLYATSNRRHLIRETWGDRSDMEHSEELHRSDTVEEKTSLSARFGLSINFNAPTIREYRDIVLTLAQRQLGSFDEAELLRAAQAWELRRGGRSGRTAQQFIDDLSGKKVEVC